MEIPRNLHFSCNLNPRAKTDRAWKIRKVVHVLQRTFRRPFIPAELAFDEAMLPSRSSFNRTRVYMKDTPCKWVSRLFCCTHTAYCIRSTTPTIASSENSAQGTTASDVGATSERVIHSAKQIDEWRNHHGQLKRVQCNCKVCSVLRSDGKRGGTTTYFCDVFFSALPVYLCMKPRYTMDDALRSYWDIWHTTFDPRQPTGQDTTTQATRQTPPRVYGRREGFRVSMQM
ncbi:hypothetical protein PR003_g15438 [Phytophthora rubi]|uniref:PiggyBac transposable element-derived protein domain-containing protein n=1 Tax=Phytophthora rubi TaxID=129364 RepID=A0A6A4EY88_9STRA|nr:hypothetical protein PR003_g15438 [Phytophthora rubi]